MKSKKESHVAKKKKSSGDWHVSHTSMGMGDYYGTGVKNPMGKMRDGVGMYPISSKGLKTPPRSLA